MRTIVLAGLGAALFMILLFSVLWVLDVRKRTMGRLTAGHWTNAAGFGLLPGIAVWKAFDAFAGNTGNGKLLFQPIRDIPWITADGRFVPGRIEFCTAVLLLAGMIIDTQRWRVRTGARTYEAASELRKMGADPQTAYDYLKDSYDEFAMKSEIMSASEKLAGGIMIAPVSQRGVSRSLISQVADSLLSIQDVNAAFVIADNDKSETCISARSNGTINVQRIMEMMGGGGHLTAAALQRPKSSVEALRAELIQTLDTYFKEEKADESDS